jgi:hypothetical protein
MQERRVPFWCIIQFNDYISFINNYWVLIYFF